MNASSGKWIRIWDPVVRIGHWTLVAAFFTAYLTGDDLLSVHVWAGYAVATVVGLRLIWGLIGTRYARFSDFVRSPRTVLAYLGEMARHRAKRYLGHNPAGGAMIVALLVSLAVTASSGIVLYGAEEGAGPLGPMLAGGVSHGAEEAWEEIHEIFANLTLGLVVLHVLGVLLSCFAHRENLIRSMITGRKLARDDG